MESKSAGSPRQELMEQPNLDAYIHDNRERFPDGVLGLLSELCIISELKFGNNTLDLSRFSRRRKRRQPKNMAHITSEL